MKLLEIRNSKRKVDFELKISDFGLRSEISERTLKIVRAFCVDTRLRSIVVSKLS